MSGLLSDKEYLSCGGNRCPVCQSEDIRSDSIDADGTTAWANVKCNSCGSTWDDVYILSSYTNLVQR